MMRVPRSDGNHSQGMVRIKHAFDKEDTLHDVVGLLLFVRKVLLGYLGYSGIRPDSVYDRHRRNRYINLLQSVGDTKD